MCLSDLVKILSLAAVLNRLSKDESRSSLIALAWTLRNRDKISKNPLKTFRSTCKVKLISATGNTFSARPWTLLTLLGSGGDDRYCRSLAIASLVWCGEEADPTAGSTHFHRHDDWPDWAKNSEPVALIGNWFFYNQIGFPQ